MAKLLLSVSIALCLSTSAFAQETEQMRIIGNTILKGSTPMSIGMAKDISVSKSATAYLYFQKASKLRTWNVVWWIVGGYEVIAGGASLSQGSQLGAADMVLGGVLLGITPGREKKRKSYIALGIEEYNKSLK